MRFELIDAVLERQPDRIRAVKSVTVAEEYLADHFPGFAVLPGVMMLETLVQAGRLLLAADGQAGRGPWVLAQARNVRYGNMVRPGQSLVVEVALMGRSDDGYDLKGIGKVNDDVAVQARFRLTPVPPRNLPDNNNPRPEL